MIKKNVLRIVSIGTTPMTRKINEFLEYQNYIVLAGVVNMIPEKYFQRSNYDPMFEIKGRRPNDILYIHDINSPVAFEWIKSREPDLIIQSGWSQIWEEKILSLPNKFCLGVHAAPLPNGRGAAILNWKLIEGGGEWGNSLFVMEEKTDMGDILDFEPFHLENRDDIKTAYFKAERTAIKMLNRTLPKILDNTFIRIPQNKILGKRYYKRKPEDGLMEFNWDSTKIFNFVRALTSPYPGAFFYTKFGKMMVWSAEIYNEASTEHCGSVLKILSGKGIVIQTGNQSQILLKLIQIQNDIEVWSDIWALEQNWTENKSLI